MSLNASKIKIGFESLKFMMKPNAMLSLGVYELSSQLFSKYDLCAGHIRRYSLQALEKILRSHHFTIKQSTYWGLWLTPLLWTRKYFLHFVKKADVIVQGAPLPTGF